MISLIFYVGVRFDFVVLTSIPSCLYIFPSFDKIVVRKQVIIVDDPYECNQLAISNHSEHA